MGSLDERPNYLVYMLRLWQAGAGDDIAWRASLENPQTGERHAFGTLAALFDFIGQNCVQRGVDSAPGAGPAGEADIPEAHAAAGPAGGGPLEHGGAATD